MTLLERIRSARAARSARVERTRRDVAEANWVRTSQGWTPILEVNENSVTVPPGGGGGFRGRIRFARILETSMQ